MTQPRFGIDAAPLPQLNSDAATVPPSQPLTEPVAAASPGQAPPHVLWASLEAAYAGSEDDFEERRGNRLPGYVGVAITLGLSLVLWAIIVALVRLR